MRFIGHVSTTFGHETSRNLSSKLGVTSKTTVSRTFYSSRVKAKWKETVMAPQGQRNGDGTIPPPTPRWPPSLTPDLRCEGRNLSPGLIVQALCNEGRNLPPPHNRGILVEKRSGSSSWSSDCVHDEEKNLESVTYIPGKKAGSKNLSNFNWQKLDLDPSSNYAVKQAQLDNVPPSTMNQRTRQATSSQTSSSQHPPPSESSSPPVTTSESCSPPVTTSESNSPPVTTSESNSPPTLIPGQGAGHSLTFGSATVIIPPPAAAASRVISPWSAACPVVSPPSAPLPIPGQGARRLESATVGLMSKTHAVIIAFKGDDQYSHQYGIYYLGKNIAFSIAGLTDFETSAVSKIMRNEYSDLWAQYHGRLSALTDAVGIDIQWIRRTFDAVDRPYGVGMLVVGCDNKGLHIFYGCPPSKIIVCKAMAIGARSQSAQTYFQMVQDNLSECDLKTLIGHGLVVLRKCLPADAELSDENVSIAVIGEEQKFKTFDNKETQSCLADLDTVKGGRIGAAEEPAAGDLQQGPTENPPADAEEPAAGDLQQGPTENPPADAEKSTKLTVGLMSNTDAVIIAFKYKIKYSGESIAFSVAGHTAPEIFSISKIMEVEYMQFKVQPNWQLSILTNAVGGSAGWRPVDVRPNGVDQEILVAGYDSEGPQIFRGCPPSEIIACKATAIGAQSQLAQTYFEKVLEDLSECDLKALIGHGLVALRKCLPADAELSVENVSIAVIGVDSDQEFKILDNKKVLNYLADLDTVKGGRIGAAEEPMAEDQPPAE